MNSAQFRLASLLVVLSLLLSGCTGSLWGSYSAYLTPTSTPAAPVLTPDPASSASPTDLPPSPTPEVITPTLSIPTDQPTAVVTPTQQPTLATLPSQPTVTYLSQSGDSMQVIAAHFGVSVGEIMSPSPLPETGFVNPGTLMFIPDRLKGVEMTPSTPVIPDCELVYSPCAVAFDIQSYVLNAGGKLSTFREPFQAGVLSGPDGVERISIGSSMSPRLLLALIQYYTGWVQGTPKVSDTEKYLLGYQNPQYPGLYQQMRLMVGDLLTGYYSWRAGSMETLTFPDGKVLRIAPSQNAGSVAIMYMFSRHLNYADWLKLIDDPNSGFLALFKSMFGDPFEWADELGPLFPANMVQPTFTLPFEVGSLWAFTGGPHPAWEQETAYAALDFAPASAASGCTVSNAWVVAIAPGWIVRSGDGFVVLDMDPDGLEQTGWDVLYQHIATKDRIAVGTRVAAGDHIGHPSCEGGTATGTHLHITRKYNGEWVAAGGPIPFVMSGWTAHAGSAPYKGTLTKGDLTITANVNSTHESQIIRQSGE